VPAYSEATARATAERHGVTAETFALYPAYGAIVDSVLKGAHLALAEATAVEMTQFLRLMFSPVAGCMVRTLFLERLRAERELAAPEGAVVERICSGTAGAARGAWAEALARTKLPLEIDPDLPPDTLELFGRDGSRCRIAIGVVEARRGAAPATPLAVLSPAGPYGRVIESVGADDATHALVAALATRLRALAWRTPGPESVLQRLRGASLADQATIALESAAADRAGDPAFLDTAACLAGVSPTWSGGPLTWAWAERDGLRSHPAESVRRAWDKLEPALARSFA